jgi:uncharacterized protein
MQSTMRSAKRARLVAKGWRVGGAREWLNLSDQEPCSPWAPRARTWLHRSFAQRSRRRGDSGLRHPFVVRAEASYPVAMADITEPLSRDETDRLDAFLLHRFPPDNEMELGADEGIFDISGLDGFLTAVVSGPVTLLPSEWIPAIWGDFEPIWKADEEAEDILTLIVRHMNGIVWNLGESPDDFEPMFLENTVNRDAPLVVDEWCEGYVRGMALCAEAWDTAPPEIMELLKPILAFTEAASSAAHDLEDANEASGLRDAIAPNARAIHAYWLAQRMGDIRVTPFRRDEPRVGRNDPCPCGSGKKYKRCCLQ